MDDGAAAPTPAVLHADAAWRSVDLISDLHLQEADAATLTALRRWLAATDADAVFILGDLFEAWVGDDAAQVPGFAAGCLRLLADAAQRRPLYFMHGNRDFLVGDAFIAASGMRPLTDPTLLRFGEHAWLLTHGDLLCVDDVPYQQYRAQVRSPQWIAQFLAKPLAQREAVARQMREASRKHQAALPTYADVDDAAARAWLREAGAPVLVHGHTHHPADHALGDGLRRIVLSDWDAAAASPRAEAVRLWADGRHERRSLGDVAPMIPRP